MGRKRWVVALLVLTAAPAAIAQDKKAEATARALQKKAMEEEYLASDFQKAQQSIDKAIAVCVQDRCSPALRSRLYRDLGVIQIGSGADHREAGVKSLVEALRIDPTVTIDADLRTKDLDQAFADAKKIIAPEVARIDFIHVPPPEQTLRTPLPIYAEYKGSETLARVSVRYRGFGMADWKVIELKKTGSIGWSGLLPCGEMQQGTTIYYFQGYDSRNDVVAALADRNKPITVPIRATKVASPPHLPGQPPPAQCADTDCPPDFPGCKKPKPILDKEVEREEGEFCEEDNECRTQHCIKSQCSEPPGAPPKASRFFVGVSGVLDFVVVPNQDDVCKLQGKVPRNDENFYCVHRDSGADYPSRVTPAENDALIPTNPGSSDRVRGGSAPSNVRVMLSLDWAFKPNILFGTRLGFVFNTYPGSAAEDDKKRFAVPIHLELRATYLFGGKDVLTREGLAPMAFGAVGLAPFETSIPVEAIEITDSARRREVDAWHIAGPYFVALGAGARYTITPKIVLTGAMRGNLAFGNATAGFAPELGAQYGF